MLRGGLVEKGHLTGAIIESMKVTQPLAEFHSQEKMGEINILPLSPPNFWDPSGTFHWPTPN